MEKDKNEIDELIAKALNEEEAEFYDKLEQPGVLEEALNLYKGKYKYLNIYVSVVMLCFVVAGYYSIVRFFDAEEMKDLMIWGGAFFLSMVIIMALKVWSWMQMDKNVLLREIKRLELQVSALAKGVKSVER